VFSFSSVAAYASIKIPKQVELRLFKLEAVSVSPTQNLLEHQVIQIAYKLTVSWSAIGLATNPAPLSGAVCPESNEGTCIVIPDLQPGDYHGTIEARAPSASPEAQVRVQLVNPPPCIPAGPCAVSTLLHLDVSLIQASDPVLVPIAASYNISIDRFTIFKMRSRFHDEVKISLRTGLEGVSSGDSLCSRAGAHLCAILVSEGSHTTGASLDGPHEVKVVAVRNVEVGPFNLIPEVSPNIVFEYDIFNLGEPYSQKSTKEFFDSMSLLAAGVLNAVMNRSPVEKSTGKSIGTSGTFDKLDTWAHLVHGLAECDGPVAGDAINFLNKFDPLTPQAPTLDLATRGTGKFTSDPKSFEGVDSGPGCGGNSLYEVVWSVNRVSWRP